MSLEKIANKSVAVVLSNATLQEAAKVMRENHVGNVVVVKARETLTRPIPIGILTDRDIVVSTVAFGVDPTSVLAEEVMSSELIVARVHDGFLHVLHLMKEHGIKRIPLVGKEGELVGIVSSDDIVKILASEISAVSGIIDKQKKVEAARRGKFP